MSWLDDPQVRAFEAAAVDPSAFGHREHLFVAWCYLKELSLEQAVPRYVHHLQQLTRALGAPHKYHATMTWAYVVLLSESMYSPGLEGADFDALLARCPRLLDARGGLLHDYYDAGELSSDHARRRFVLPRRHVVT